MFLVTLRHQTTIQSQINQLMTRKKLVTLRIGDQEETEQLRRVDDNQVEEARLTENARN